MIYRISIVATICATLSSPYLSPAAAATSLEGTIKHQEVIEPLLEGAKPGRDFSNTRVKQSGDQTWVRIPNWLAGNWMSLSALRTFRYDEAQAATDSSSQILQIKSRENYGLQADGKGDIWTLTEVGEPVITKEEATVDGDDGAAKKQTINTYTYVKNDFAQADGDKVTIKAVSTEVRVDAATNQITNVVTHKVERQLVYLGEDRFVSSNDDRAFDSDGFPLYRQKTTCVYRRLAAFKGDEAGLRSKYGAAFEKYLEKTGRLDLKYAK